MNKAIHPNGIRGAAFLIGNSTYKPLPPLATPVSDIDVLSYRLEALNFETYVVPNATFTMMNLLIAQFRERVRALPSNTSVMFYFAGHGVQSGGENFLLPVDTQPPTDGEWRFRAVELSAVLEALCWRRDQQKLIAIDACRTNGVGSSTRSAGVGLTGVSTDRYSGMHETMILFAARPGQVALDGGALGASPFCRAMLGAFEQPHRPLNALAPDITLRVEDYTNGHQEPWNTNNMKRMHAAPFVHVETMYTPPPIVKGPQPSEDEVRSLGHLVHKLKAKDSTGRWAYYFVLVMPDLEARFLKSIEGSGFDDINNYGWVIASNYGEFPSNEVKAYLKEKYGFDM